MIYNWWQKGVPCSLSVVQARGSGKESSLNEERLVPLKWYGH
jgi:hypothetical protein